MTWTDLETGDNNPGIWVGTLAWDDTETWNDGWVAVDPDGSEWADVNG